MPDPHSLTTRLDSVSTDAVRLDAVRAVGQRMSEHGRTGLDYRWPLTARYNQTPPDGLWTAWILMAGRGFGKTRTGAEWVRSQVESGRAGRIALVARTPAEIRDTMIQGQSGLLSICPPWSMPEYESTKKKLTWPNGATAFLFSSYEPDQLRGPQFDAAWCDELASWKYPRDTWDNLAFALRLGPRSALCRHDHSQAHRPAQRACRPARRYTSPGAPPTTTRTTWRPASTPASGPATRAPEQDDRRSTQTFSTSLKTPSGRDSG